MEQVLLNKVREVTKNIKHLLEKEHYNQVEYNFLAGELCILAELLKELK